MENYPPLLVLVISPNFSKGVVLFSSLKAPCRHHLRSVVLLDGPADRRFPAQPPVAGNRPDHRHPRAGVSWVLQWVWCRVFWSCLHPNSFQRASKEFPLPKFLRKGEIRCTFGQWVQCTFDAHLGGGGCLCFTQKKNSRCSSSSPPKSDRRLIVSRKPDYQTFESDGQFVPSLIHPT